MKKTIGFFILLIATSPAFACDETCRKQQAATKHGVQFPSYMSRKYCGDIAMEFMTTTIKSLQSYRLKQLPTKHRGGMNNTNRFMTQRREWLQECDQYLALTNYGRIFKDKPTTEKIMSAMESVDRELTSLIKGATYANDGSSDTTSVAAEKFDHLFKLVDNHKTLLQLKGQFVIR